MGKNKSFRAGSSALLFDKLTFLFLNEEYTPTNIRNQKAPSRRKVNSVSRETYGGAYQIEFKPEYIFEDYGDAPMELHYDDQI